MVVATSFSVADLLRATRHGRETDFVQALQHDSLGKPRGADTRSTVAIRTSGLTNSESVLAPGPWINRCVLLQSSLDSVDAFAFDSTGRLRQHTTPASAASQRGTSRTRTFHASAADRTLVIAFGDVPIARDPDGLRRRRF